MSTLSKAFNAAFALVLALSDELYYRHIAARDDFVEG